MTTFQRARNDEQREIRRRAILDTAAAMLAEMPVAQVTLNELSRRVGLAKSNVLRYFESREAVLLELLDVALREWLAELDAALASAVDPAAPATERGTQVAEAVAASLAAKPVLCDLVSAQAAVLERNVSPQIAATYKRAALADVGILTALIRRHLPELDEKAAFDFVAAAVMITGAVWTHARPSAAMLAAYEADPELAALCLDFAPTLRDILEVQLAGLLVRAAS
ncbi:TetR/AcrR family transcriptional regulator [Yinghuangia soli]|uniref:TetR family transcriptional regulator n=1 Tax=Yinghuangia soli TaxID=2908204 RepID=A0AA41Q986_9ACTN|nr:TetR family transcriptional regulator [Yinghuangia soli]MCF2533602.1 TetR family transcriptional regulator [Yinghuangia soli]